MKNKNGSQMHGSTAHGSRVTTDHEEIKHWVEERGGKPCAVKNTMDGTVGLLRIDFPGYSGGDSLVEISWDEFFDQFDRKRLQFLYQEETTSGEPSRFNKFISEENKK
ncbi:MAG: hypothetical protein ACTHJ0_11710 [Flavipsychrobacter sp.]